MLYMKKYIREDLNGNVISVNSPVYVAIEGKKAFEYTALGIESGKF